LQQSKQRNEDFVIIKNCLDERIKLRKRRVVEKSLFNNNENLRKTCLELSIHREKLPVIMSDRQPRRRDHSIEQLL